MEPPQLPKGPTGSNARGDPLRKSETRTNDGNCQQRHGATWATMRRDRPTRPTQRNGRGHAQDIPREHKQSPPQKRTRPPPRRSEGWNERLRQGLQLRNKREKGDRPLKGKDQAESEELSLTLCLREGKSKRTDSPRAPREPSGRGRSSTRRRSPPSLKDNPLTGGRAGQVDLEVDRRSREHNGENQEPPKTRSLREDHTERGNQRL